MNLENRLTKEMLSKKKDRIKKILFYRVCGTGMGAAACLMKEAGFDIYGIDRDYFPPMSDYLNESQVQLLSFDQVNLSEFDLIVVGNVVPKGSEDAKKIENSGVFFCSFPEVIGEFILKNKNVIGVSGTHGKTTSSYFLVQIFEQMGLRPGYLIGGVIEGRASSSMGNSEYFIIESDEYDTAYFEKTPKFFHYEINHLIITSIEYDHADIYESLLEITDHFKTLSKKTNGIIVGNTDYEAIKNLVKIKPMVEINEKMFEMRENGFVLEKSFYEFKIKQKYNILNLLGGLVLLSELGFTEHVNLDLNSLKLVKRRQEYIGEFKGASVYDDFAHHPTALKLTIESFSSDEKFGKLCVVFEPASSTARSDIFQKDLPECFLGAGIVFVIEPSRPTSAKNANTLNTEKLKLGLLDEGIICETVSDKKSLINLLSRFRENYDTIILLSNGPLLGVKKELFDS
ncbi:MAG: hypothetical protein CME61_03035 [Halobacteriovoraceae bacterium]|nr:hypothetical protein [Halobacteriovoraceae bacterium]|tara:strand:- start:3098 stop:4468 length:1371 start_codon:yes stop_codon:yes gene_type:complete